MFRTHTNAFQTAISQELLQSGVFDPVRTIQGWIAVARQRRELAALEDHQFRDLGLDRADAMREAARPFWDIRGCTW